MLDWSLEVDKAITIVQSLWISMNIKSENSVSFTNHDIILKICIHVHTIRRIYTFNISELTDYFSLFGLPVT